MCPERNAVNVELALESLHFLRHWKFARTLATDPVVRGVSMDARPPTFWKHLCWMWRWSRWPWGKEYAAWVVVLGQPTKQLPRPAGIVRVGWTPELGAYEVHIALMRWARGQGIGTRVLSRIAEVAEQSGARPLVAQIKNGNPGSMRAFEKAGFTPVWFSDGIAQLEYGAHGSRSWDGFRRMEN